MAIPRSRLFDPSKPVTCHCISRCVRRNRLLEQEERRRMLRARMTELARFFAIDVLEWAFLTNHFHVVVATHPDLAAVWTDREVATRWRTLSPDYLWRLRNKVDRALPAQPQEIAAALADPALVARWRRDLASLSVFHKFLKQRIALLINLADDVTGHCWEGRFKSIVALDDEAVIAHMVYVALNPVRAFMAGALDEYEFSSIAERIEELRIRIRAGEFEGEADAARKRLQSTRLVPAMPCDPGAEVKRLRKLPSGLANPWLGGRIPAIAGGATLAAFLAEADAAGRLRRGDKRGFIAQATASPLAELDALLAKSRASGSSRLALAAREALAGVEPAMSRARGGAWGSFSGGARALARHAREMGRRFVVGIAAGAGGRRRVAAEPDAPGAVPARSTC